MGGCFSCAPLCSTSPPFTPQMFIKLTTRCQEPKDELSEAPTFSWGDIQKERAAPWPLSPFPGLEKEVKKAAVDLGCSACSSNVERGIVHTVYSPAKGGK